MSSGTPGTRGYRVVQTGAEEAAGQVVVFLNDDTIPLPGYHALLRTFRTHLDAVVGGRLVYPTAGSRKRAESSSATAGRELRRDDFGLTPSLHARASAITLGRCWRLHELFRWVADETYRPAY
jgi:GT2 family glycosyltransferase